MTEHSSEEVTAEQDPWLAKHKGDYLWTEGRVWDCGDDHCRCSQAQVVDVFKNKTEWRDYQGQRWVVRLAAWEGKFYTDGESGAAEELLSYRRALRESDPEREAATRWDFEWPDEPRIRNEE
jgi:hypothetical protein